MRKPAKLLFTLSSSHRNPICHYNSTELIPINKVEELIMCGLYCLTTTFTDEEEEEVIISRSTQVPQFDRAAPFSAPCTLIINCNCQPFQRETTTLPFTLSKIYRTFESVFTAHANPRVVGGGKLRRARRNRWLVTDIIETLAIQKRLANAPQTPYLSLLYPLIHFYIFALSLYHLQDSIRSTLMY